MTIVTCCWVRLLAWLLAGSVIGLLSPVSVLGANFELQLRAQTDNQDQTSHSDPSTDKPPARRPLLTAKAGDPLKVEWSVASLSGADTMPNVTVHFFLNREKVIGQAELPELGPDVVFESALVMDFAPQSKSSANYSIQMPGPGNYMLRVETLRNTGGQGAPEFAAIDLKVQ